MSVPTSTSVLETAVIPVPLSQVWHLIKLQNFSDFWSLLKSSEFVKGASEEADLVRWTFKDGSWEDVKQEEHSTINHYITYSVIASNPSLPYTSVLSTIRCHAVTTGSQEGSTFVEWSGHFSSDADAGAFNLLPCDNGVIADAKYKRQDALRDLAKKATEQQ